MIRFYTVLIQLKVGKKCINVNNIFWTIISTSLLLDFTWIEIQSGVKTSFLSSFVKLLNWKGLLIHMLCCIQYITYCFAGRVCMSNWIKNAKRIWKIIRRRQATDSTQNQRKFNRLQCSGLRQSPKQCWAKLSNLQKN